MAKKECILCGVEYDVCAYCPATIQQTPWRQLCDSSRHFQIYMIVRSLRSGILKEDEAREQLDSLKVTTDEIKSFVPSVRRTLFPLYRPAAAEKTLRREPAFVPLSSDKADKARTSEKEK